MIYNEIYLHYIWLYKLFSQQHLCTSDGQLVEILSPGFLNADAGPDFYESKIRIDNTIWVGNVEIHLRASDWIRHRHQEDAAYENVILHVVWEQDAPVFRQDGTLIPALELNSHVFDGVIDRIDQLMHNQNWIACEHRIGHIDPFIVQQWLDRVLIERLEDKSRYFFDLNQNLKGSWEDTFYIGLARSFGFKVNALPFELLAKLLSQHLLGKHKHQVFQLEALIFGVSGLLNFNYQDPYPRALSKEFKFLKTKYKLQTVEAHLWKFSKTRPDNFPSIRLAQFAALINTSVHLFSKIIELRNDVQALRTLFFGLKVNTYWETHFIFDKPQEQKTTSMGHESIDILLINTIVPLLFCYEKTIGKSGYAQRAMDMLEMIRAENNNIIRGFKRLGIRSATAFDSQALLQLKNFYCNHKKCLNCGIGLSVLKSV